MEWKTEIKEISNNIYKLTLTHPLGPKIEKTGTNLNQLKKEAKEDSIKLDKQIELKLEEKRKLRSKKN